MINEVHAVLRDVQDGADFEITTAEMGAGLRERLQPLLARGGGRIEVEGPGDIAIRAREAGLGGLVLVNLAQNALEAGGRTARVRVSISVETGVVQFEVADGGPGLPAEVLADPFRPRRSTKPDGAGIGLAISRELARHAGGELSLVRSSPQGTAFCLRLPAAARRPTAEPA
jgi:C4-dicarboxylate-specific signal transduction histidine kinase